MNKRGQLEISYEKAFVCFRRHFSDQTRTGTHAVTSVNGRIMRHCLLNPNTLRHRANSPGQLPPADDQAARIRPDQFGRKFQ